MNRSFRLHNKRIHSGKVLKLSRHVLYYRYNDIFIQIWYIIFQKEKSESDEENQTTPGKEKT